MATEHDEPEIDDQIITCWCGVRGTADELFDFGGLDSSCGGTGYVDCYCGGDQCVCHHHGQEQECPGCDECDGLEDIDMGDFDDGRDDDHFHDEG